MKGQELLRALLQGQDVYPSLKAAIWTHIQTGESLDSILGLNGSKGCMTPRRQVLLETRAIALVSAWGILKRVADSDRQASFALHTLLQDREIEIEDEELELHVVEARTYGEMLGLAYSTPESLYRALINAEYEYAG